MSEIDLDALERLEKAATPGPWVVQRYCNYNGYGLISDKLGCICERWEDTPSDERLAELRATGDFIAALRNAAPAIIAEIRRLRSVEADLRGSRDHLLGIVKEIGGLVKPADGQRTADAVKALVQAATEASRE